MTKFITLTADHPSDVTVVSNRFIDDYLPQANGEFVKIFLYLLRWLNCRRQMSLECIADTLHMTEKDVLRALRYWEECGLLQLAADADGDLAGIGLCTEVLSGGPSREADGLSVPVSEIEETDPAGNDTPVPENTAAVKADADISADDAAPRSPESGSLVQYDMKEICSFQEKEENSQMLFMIQTYLGHTLSSQDLNMIYYFYDNLGFSTDLIIELFEYCVENGHTHMRYIEKVALSWAEQHITTAEEAREQTKSYNQICFSVLRAFGLNNRMPTPGETDYILRWSQNYGFSQELILEACRRTMMNVHTPSFDYADKILANWKSAGIFNMQDVLTADRTYSENKRSQNARKEQAASKARPTGNRFHNFNQRTYDYDSLEKKLSRKLQESATNNSQ